MRKHSLASPTLASAQSGPAWRAPKGVGKVRLGLRIAAIVLIVLGLAGLGFKIRAIAIDTAAEARLGQAELQSGLNELANGGLDLTPTQSSEATLHFRRAEVSLTRVHGLLGSAWLQPLTGLPWLGDQILAATRLSDMGMRTARVGDLFLARLEQVPRDPASLPAGQPGKKLLNLLSALDPAMPALSSEIDRIVSDRRSIPRTGLVGPLAHAVAAIDKRIDLLTLGNVSSNLRTDETAIRSVLGGDSPQSYLVLQQDPAELRATGGFIGSVGFLSVNQGAIAPFISEDIDKIDRNALGAFSLGGPGTPNHVDLPEPLREAFQIPSWMLRDANWSPDFPTTARQAEFFLQKESGQTVTGVLAIDPFLVERLLAVTGPLNVAGETVDKNNFFSKTLYHSELGSGPNRKSFLTAAGKEVVGRALGLPVAKWPTLLQAIGSGCIARSFQMYFHDPAAESLATRYGCGGQVRQVSGDYLMVVETNLGGNKDDFWMKRKYSLRIAVDGNGHARHVLQLHYYGLSQHELELTQYHGYKGWLRVYLPPTAALVSANGAQLDSTTDRGHRVFQGWFYVKFDQTADISIVYDVNLAPKPLAVGQLELTWQKQAGRVADPITVDLSLPPGWQLGQVHSSAGDESTGPVRSSLSEDRRFVFDFRRS